MNQPRELILLTQASRALEQARTVDEVKDLRDKAEAVKAYARKAKLGQEIVVEASLIKVNAERKLGEMLRETELADSAPGNQYTGKKEPKADDRPTLAGLGISKSDSSRLQQIAGLSHEVFQRFIDESMSAKREPTTAALLRLAKQHQNGSPAQQAASDSETEHYPPAQPAVVTDRLEELIQRGQRFGTVYADPPWPYKSHGIRAATSNPRPTMSVDAICAEPVPQLIGEQAHLHLWTTNAYLLDAFDVIESWGFEYKSCFVWVWPQIGIGNYWRVSHKFLLLGVRGGLSFADHTKRSWHEEARTENSQKPESVRQLVEQVSPPEYLELYGRLPIAGWTVYGDELR